MKFSNTSLFAWLAAALVAVAHECHGLTEHTSSSCSRRATLGWLGGAGAGAGAGLMFGTSAAWGGAAVQDSMDVDKFLRTGLDGGGNMGVSSQAGKSRPETGVFLRYAPNSG